MVNKADETAITDDEAFEFACILSTLAQVISNVDDIRSVYNVSTGVDYHLMLSKQKINQQIQNLDDRLMNTMH